MPEAKIELVTENEHLTRMLDQIKIKPQINKMSNLRLHQQTILVEENDYEEPTI
jgi:hypothetical protein